MPPPDEGRCLQQCLMFIFGEDESIIPHFVSEPHDMWLERLVDWASNYGLYAMYLDGQGGVPEDLPYVAVYETCDETQNHAVVKINDDIIYDPAEGREFDLFDMDGYIVFLKKSLVGHIPKIPKFPFPDHYELDN